MRSGAGLQLHSTFRRLGREIAQSMLIWCNTSSTSSSHSALITSVTTSIGLNVGWGSPLFALAIALTGIVVYDATGVRRQAGIQAERINQIVRELLHLKKLDETEVT